MGFFIKDGKLYGNATKINVDNALNAGIDINQFMPVTLDELIINNKIFKENH